MGEKLRLDFHSHLLHSEAYMEPEHIGDLIFVQNPDYPYPFPVEPPPHFWMTEQTGKLAAAMEDYFAGEKLQPTSLATIKT